MEWYVISFGKNENSVSLNEGRLILQADSWEQAMQKAREAFPHIFVRQQSVGNIPINTLEEFFEIINGVIFIGTV